MSFGFFVSHDPLKTYSPATPARHIHENQWSLQNIYRPLARHKKGRGQSQRYFSHEGPSRSNANKQMLGNMRLLYFSYDICDGRSVKTKAPEHMYDFCLAVQ